jgi:rhodanese-related sulfurtransferase
MSKENVFDAYPQRAGVFQLQAKDLSGLPDEVRFVDVRGVEEYTGELGHLPRAELVPLGTLAQAAADWERAQPLLMICRSGNRSGQAASALLQAGFLQVANLNGGMAAVRAEGL